MKAKRPFPQTREAAVALFLVGLCESAAAMAETGATREAIAQRLRAAVRLGATALELGPLEGADLVDAVAEALDGEAEAEGLAS
jgi:hypothetical protein